jgi:hypothetical protein
MLMKKPSHRVFDFPTRFYIPEQDDKERKKRKLGFSKQIRHRKKTKSPIIWILFILVVLFFIIKFGSY